MATDLSRNWWLLALRGIAGILFGIAAFVWPESTLTALVLVFGAYVFVDGIFALIAGIGMRRQLSLWWLVLLEGVAGIILGLLTFRSPDITALVLLSFIAAWSIITAVRDAIEQTAQNGDGGSNDLLMGDVLRRHEQQVWGVAEHLVDTPLLRA